MPLRENELNPIIRKLTDEHVKRVRQTASLNVVPFGQEVLGKREALQRIKELSPDKLRELLKDPQRGPSIRKLFTTVK